MMTWNVSCTDFTARAAAPRVEGTDLKGSAVRWIEQRELCEMSGVIKMEEADELNEIIVWNQVRGF